MAATIKITDITHYNQHHGILLGYSLDFPRMEFDTYAIEIRGWLLGQHHAVTALYFADNLGRDLEVLPVNLARPDVAQHFPQHPAAQTCGFFGMLNVLGLSQPTAEIRIVATLADNSVIPIANLQIERTPLQAGKNARLQPLIVNSIGRTGTTWVMRLLLEHERVAAYAHYPYEARVTSYWLHSVLKMHDILPRNPETLHIINQTWMNSEMTLGTRLGYWFSRDYQEQLAEFCCRSIEQAYLQVAEEQGKDLQALSQETQPVYYAEKFGPGYMPELLWELYPGTREILLVRDFRDMYCSILKFTHKKGVQADFNCAADTDEADIIRSTAERIKQLVDDWQRRKDKVYLLRYEDLILQPEASLTKLFDYLQLDNSPEAIRSLLQRATVDTDNLREHRTSSSVTASIGRWKSELTDRQKALMKAHVGDYLELFDYEW